MWRLSVSGLYDDHVQTVYRSACPRCLLIQALQVFIVAVGGGSLHNGHWYVYDTTSPSTLRCEIGCTWKGSPCSTLTLKVAGAGAGAGTGAGAAAGTAAVCGATPTGLNSHWRRCIRPRSCFTGVRLVALMSSCTPVAWWMRPSLIILRSVKRSNHHTYILHCVSINVRKDQMKGVHTNHHEYCAGRLCQHDFDVCLKCCVMLLRRDHEQSTLLPI